MYCKFCGYELRNDAETCNVCGGRVKDASTATPPTEGQKATVVISPKSVGLGILFSFILAGGGQLYADRVSRGITILLLSIVCLFTGVLLLFPLLIYLILWIWAIFDAKNKLEEYNRHLRTHGVPPW